MLPGLTFLAHGRSANLGSHHNYSISTKVRPSFSTYLLWMCPLTCLTLKHLARSEHQHDACNHHVDVALARLSLGRQSSNEGIEQNAASGADDDWRAPTDLVGDANVDDGGNDAAHLGEGAVCGCHGAEIHLAVERGAVCVDDWIISAPHADVRG